MKLTKNIEVFDKNSFEVGSLYYLNFEKWPDEEDFEGAIYSGIFVCILVSTCDDYVHLYPIKYFDNSDNCTVTKPITIHGNNYKNISYISKLSMNTESFTEGPGNVIHISLQQN